MHYPLLLLTCEEKRVVLSGCNLDNAVPAQGLNQGGAFPVLGVAQTELALVVAAP